MKIIYDHGNTYKGKHSIGADLQFKALVHYHHGREHYDHAGRYLTGGGTEFYISICRQQGETVIH